VIQGVFVGDGDELDFTYEVERVFGIELTDEECEACATMGDVEALVWRHVSQRGGAQDRCMTAMAFHELRRAFPTPNGQRKIGPATAITAFGLNAGRFRGTLLRATGLELPGYETLLSLFGALSCLLGIIFALGSALHMLFSLSTEALSTFAAAVTAVVLGMLALRFDPGSFQAIRTVGDAARHVADRNFAAFAARGGRYDRESIWRVLRHVAGGEIGCRADDISRETLIIMPGRLRLLRRLIGA
jgi:hypothetical protein